MIRFELEEDDGHLLIIHNIAPKCEVEVIILERQALWSEVASFDSLFDLFVFKKNDVNILFMLLVYNGEDVDEHEVPAYRHMLKRAWRWYVHRYLLGSEQHPGKPRIINYEPYEDELFSFEEIEGKRWVYHRGYPVFRLPVPHDFKGGDLNMDELEFIDEVDSTNLSTKMRELGDWLALNL